MPVPNTKISVKITPNSGRNEIAGLSGEVWRIKVAAPPEKGKANKELIEFLSEILGIRKDKITLIRGLTSHNKVIAIDGLSPEAISARFSAGKKP
jgi:uncharacterized protein